MAKEKKENNRLLAFTGMGMAALVAVALNIIITTINSHKKRKSKELPGLNVHVNLSASDIIKLTDRIITKSKEVHDAVGSVPLDKVTYMNVISPLAELEAQQFPLVQSCTFLKMVSVSDDLRKASAEAERRIDAHSQICRHAYDSFVHVGKLMFYDFMQGDSQREDVCRVVKAFAAKGEWMSHEAKHYIQCLIRDFERNGLNLTSSKKQEVQRLRTQIDELSIRYIQNLNDDNTFLLFSETELFGLPSDFIKNVTSENTYLYIAPSSHLSRVENFLNGSLGKAENGKLKVMLKSHHVVPLLEFCKVGTTRKTVAVAYGRRCGEANLPILENMVRLRHKLARLLGYLNYADYAVEPRMAKTSAKVFEFLEDISVNLNDLATRELTILKDLKKKEEGESSFGVEDLLYYVKRVESQRSYLDFRAVKKYFPISVVLSGIFKIFQDLFGLRFEEIADAEVWHNDVRLFSALDFSSSELLGYFYLDIYSRDGKYGHTCVISLQNGSLSYNGARQMPVALLISQFQKEVDGDPGLLRFSEVVDLFHEFGHVVHHICNRASFARFSGLRVDPDFVEIPALLIENWCYESIPLKLISGFHQDITNPITDEICGALKRRQDSFSALKLKQEILLSQKFIDMSSSGLFDQIIHTTENVDTVELLKHLHQKVMLGLPMLEGVNPASCFPRIAIGYEASCYSRMWSEVFAADIFVSKFQDGLMDQYVGLQFRNKVLAPGGAKDPTEILSDFLGREPSIQGYIKNKTRNSL